MISSETPRVSIHMCNYNNAPYLRTAIDSVSAQSFRDWELTIVDDCSTDESAKILRSYAEKDSRIQLHFNETNQGYGKSIAKNIEISRGYYGAILDPDDSLAPEALEIMVSHLGSHAHQIAAYSQLFYCDENLTPLRVFENTREIPPGTTYLEYGNMAMTHFIVFARQKFLDYGNVDTGFRNALDQDWYFKLEEIGEVGFVKQPLYYYRVAPTGLSQGLKKKYLTALDCFELKKKAIDRRQLRGLRKFRIINRARAELAYFRFKIAKEDGWKLYSFINKIMSIFWNLIAKL